MPFQLALRLPFLRALARLVRQALNAAMLRTFAALALPALALPALAGLAGFLRALALRVFHAFLAASLRAFLLLLIMPCLSFWLALLPAYKRLIGQCRKNFRTDKWAK
jgi:hypothetical protein